jgi:hypothetical protein
MTGRKLSMQDSSTGVGTYSRRESRDYEKGQEIEQVTGLKEPLALGSI